MAQPSEQWTQFEATAYVADCEGCTGYTYYTGYDVRDTIYVASDQSTERLRVIAVDPAVVPLGSTVEVRLADGETFTARAMDIGGAIDGREIDLLVADEGKAWNFGRQDVELRIINEGEDGI